MQTDLGRLERYLSRDRLTRRFGLHGAPKSHTLENTNVSVAHS